MGGTGTIETKDDFAYQPVPNKLAANPGFEASLYAKADGAVQTIKLDQSLFLFDTALNWDGRRTSRTIYPGTPANQHSSLVNGIFPCSNITFLLYSSRS